MGAKEKTYYENMVQHMVGATITNIVIVSDESDKDYGTRPVIVLVAINKGKTYNCEILSDEEGNDAGIIEVREVTK
jgi:hypothetical protein